MVYFARERKKKKKKNSTTVYKENFDTGILQLTSVNNVVSSHRLCRKVLIVAITSVISTRGYSHILDLLVVSQVIPVNVNSDSDYHNLIMPITIFP